jgi:type IV secretory pathway TrbL component
MKKEVTIAKGKAVPRGVESEMKKKPGGSNVGKYKDVKSFAGKAGGAPAGSYPINTEKRAKAALAYAHNAPNPAGIKSAVHKKYPGLGGPKKKSK